MGENPTRQSLQPEAIGAVMEVTKWLKPSISVSRIGDSGVCRPQRESRRASLDDLRACRTNRRALRAAPNKKTA